MNETYLHNFALRTCFVLSLTWLSSHFGRGGQTEVDTIFHLPQSTGSAALPAFQSLPGGKSSSAACHRPSLFRCVLRAGASGASFVYAKREQISDIAVCTLNLKPFETTDRSLKTCSGGLQQLLKQVFWKVCTMSNWTSRRSLMDSFFHMGS